MTEGVNGGDMLPVLALPLGEQPSAGGFTDVTERVYRYRVMTERARAGKKRPFAEIWERDRSIGI